MPDALPVTGVDQLAAALAKKLASCWPSPAALFYTVDQVSTITTMSRAWIWRAASAGEFPKPRKVGSRAVWAADDVREWAEQRKSD